MCKYSVVSGFMEGWCLIVGTRLRNGHSWWLYLLIVHNESSIEFGFKERKAIAYAIFRLAFNDPVGTNKIIYTTTDSNSNFSDTELPALIPRITMNTKHRNSLSPC